MAATTMATMAMLNAKCIMNSSSSPKLPSINLSKSTKPISLLTNSSSSKSWSTSLAGTATAGAIFSTLSSCDPAMAAQQLAEIAEGGDNRGLALLLPIVPAIAWVLYNILPPALNQINKMANSKVVIVGLGLGGGLVAASAFGSPSAMAAASDQVATIAAEASSDSRGTLLLFVVAPAILWVLYNILQPALNQINNMKS